MGLVQAFTNYFYPPQKLSANLIRTKAQRLSLCIKQTQYKLQDGTFKLEQELLQQLHQNKMVRNKYFLNCNLTAVKKVILLI